MHERKGSERAINADYIQVTSELAHDMIKSTIVLQAQTQLTKRYDKSDSMRLPLLLTKDNQEFLTKVGELAKLGDSLFDTKTKLDKDQKATFSRLIEYAKKDRLPVADNHGLIRDLAQSTSIRTYDRNVGHDAKVREALVKLMKRLGELAPQATGEPIKGEKSWRDVPLPKGYVAYAPFSGHILGTEPIADSLANGLFDKGVQEILGLSPEEVAKYRAKYGTQSMIVIPEGNAKPLAEWNKKATPRKLRKAIAAGTRTWKKSVLFFPLRFPKYFIRNLFGDTQASLMGTGFKSALEVPSAWAELWDVMTKGNDHTGLLAEMQDRGLFQQVTSLQDLILECLYQCNRRQNERICPEQPRV